MLSGKPMEKQEFKPPETNGVSPAPKAKKPKKAKSVPDPLAEVESLSLFYGAKQALRDINMNIPRKQVTAFIGPSGCGKSTLLRCFNRLNDLIDDCRTEGDISINGKSIFDSDVDITFLVHKTKDNNINPQNIFIVDTARTRWGVADLLLSQNI